MAITYLSRFAVQQGQTTSICQVKTLTQAGVHSGHSGARGKHYGARGFYLKLGLKIRWPQGRAG
jgi:hypothetical protein